MPDLLAHVFIAYSICRLLSWRYEWLTSQYVTVGMVGAFIPDVVKIKLLLPSYRVQQLLGVPFDWGSLHTGGGTLLSVLVGVVLLSSDERRRAGSVLAVGAVSHLLADSLLLTPTRHTQQLVWPLHQYRVPSPGLYLSTEPGPTIVTGVAAGLIWATHRYVVTTATSED
jgi:hypothetical protein